MFNQVLKNSYYDFIGHYIHVLYSIFPYFIFIFIFRLSIYFALIYRLSYIVTLLFSLISSTLCDLLFGLMLGHCKYIKDDKLLNKEAYKTVIKSLKINVKSFISLGLIRGLLYFSTFYTFQFIGKSLLGLLVFISPIAVFYYIRFFNGYSILFYENNRNPFTRSEELNKSNNNYIFLLNVFILLFYIFIIAIIALLNKFIGNFPPSKFSIYLILTFGQYLATPIVIFLSINTYKYLKTYQINNPFKYKKMF